MGFQKSIVSSFKIGLPTNLPSEVMVETKLTTPPAHYSEATLLGDMVNAAKFVKDVKKREILKDKKGIGRPSTQGPMIEKLKGMVNKKIEMKKAYFTVEKGKLKATSYGETICGLLPESIRDPGFTAELEMKLNDIEKGNGSIKEVTKIMEDYVIKVMEEMKKVKPIKEPRGGKIERKSTECPACKKGMAELIPAGKSKKTGKDYNAFWVCGCGASFTDKSGTIGLQNKPIVGGNRK